MLIPALSLREGDEFTLHLTVNHVDRYDYSKTTIVTVGDEDLNVAVNLDGATQVDVEDASADDDRQPPEVPYEWCPHFLAFLVGRNQ